MADVEQIAKTTLEEIERLLNTKTVVGEQISVEGATLIPLVSFGFGFGAVRRQWESSRQRGRGRQRHLGWWRHQTRSDCRDYQRRCQGGANQAGNRPGARKNRRYNCQG